MSGGSDTFEPQAVSVISGAHALMLPRTLLPGQCVLQAGLYDRTTLQRLPLMTWGDTVNLGSVTVVAPSDGPKRLPCSW